MESVLGETKTFLNGLCHLCNQASREAGWWDPSAFNIVPVKIALIHSEVSEALEGWRRDVEDDHLPHRKMLEVELADVLIRVFDLAGQLELDLGGAFVEKLAFNKHRADHSKAAREQPHGKKF